ncbi:restriction endonuclease subunit S, partial [Mycoplasma zalophi]|uniref:restriction endonuclease subunit S n=1 Tax=Mycoplasma zalophi TaxID=191287 RepID=UPI0021C680B9
GTFANVILQQVAEINIKVPDKKEQEKISNTFNLFDTSISLLKRLWFCSKIQLFYVEKNAFSLKNTLVWFQQKVENLFKVTR